MESLSNELLVNIVECFLPVDGENKNAPDARSLAALCLTNKRFNSIATPLLYQAVPVQTNNTSLRLLILTLHRRPDLAAKVRSLRIGIYEVFPPNIPTEDQLAALLEAPEPISHDDEMIHGSVRSAFKRGHESADLALLLLRATGVEHVNITLADNMNPYQFAQDERWAERYGNALKDFLELLAIGATLHGALSKLRTVHISPSRDHMEFTYIDYHLAGLLMRLPSLQSLSFDGAVRVSRGDLWGGHAGTSSIKHLYLTSCIMDDPDVVSLLKFCNVLESVSIRWTKSVQEDHYLDGDDQIEALGSVIDIGPRFSRIRPALEAHAPTLLKLVLDTMTAEPVLINASDASSALGSLRSFTKLESLELDDTVLTGANDDELSVDAEDISQITAELSGFLPPNLKTFIVRTRKSLDKCSEILSTIAMNSPESLNRLRVEFPASLESSVKRHKWPSQSLRIEGSRCTLSYFQQKELPESGVVSVDCHRGDGSSRWLQVCIETVGNILS